MGLGKKWTSKEEEYLTEKWGQVSIPMLAKNLGRSVNAIKVRAARLGLGPVLMGGDFVTMNQLVQALGYFGGIGYLTKSWIRNRGFPVHNKRVVNNTFRVVYLDEFWEWAEKNRSFLDFSKMEPLALGKEPSWVAEQRRKDYQACAIQRKGPWTPVEDDRLRRLLAKRRYGWAELSNLMRRSNGAIQRRKQDLGLTDRPIRQTPHGRQQTWTSDMFEALAEGIGQVDSYQTISENIGISEKAIRGKVYWTYLTENADKVRAMMGGGPWGTGAPDPEDYPVRLAVRHSKTRTRVRNDLSTLAGLLLYRRNELGYDPYWQRFMCQNWHDLKGCTAGCGNCDECTEFLRIRPQYCSRCGATFFERAENRFCPNCRTARKKQAQKKWAVISSRTRG